MKAKKDPLDLHPPDELLATAEKLLAMDDPKTLRAAVLEAVTALEANVHDKVFLALEGQLSPLLVQWLKDKTRMDFDSRLSVLTPFATGLAVEKDSALWSDYKKARDIRHKVAHSGAKVTKKEVRFVLDTVYQWIDYLKSPVKQPEPQNQAQPPATTLDLVSRFFATASRLERLLYNVVGAVSGNGPKLHDRSFAYLELMRQGVIDRATVSRIQEYRSLRNVVAHPDSASHIPLSEKDVLVFDDIVKRIESGLRLSAIKAGETLTKEQLENSRAISLEEHGI